MKDTAALAESQSHDHVATPEPFRYETKYLVLKFLGLSNPGSSFGSRSSSSHNDSSEISPNSSILVNYQSSRSISHTSEDNWSWKSGSHSSSSASAGKLNSSSGSAGLNEFRSSSQPQSGVDRGEFAQKINKRSKSTPLTPNGSFSSESSLNISGQSFIQDDNACGRGKQQNKNSKKNLQGESEILGVTTMPGLDSPFKAEVGGDGDFLDLSYYDDIPSPIPVSHRDSVDTLKGKDEDLNLELEGRHSRQDVITSDSYESVDTLLGEEYQQVETDSVDVFDDQEEDGIQKVDEVESNSSEQGSDQLDGAAYHAPSGCECKQPAYMDLLPGPSEPPDSVKGAEETHTTDRSIKRGIGDRSGLNLEGLTQDTLTVEEAPDRLRRFSFNTTIHYLQDDVSDALANLQVELEEANRSQQVAQFCAVDGLFSPQSPSTNIAHVLGVIGDQVNQEYAHILEQASNRVLQQPTQLADYDDFRHTAEQIVDTTAQTLDPAVRHWYQASLLLCFSKRVAVGMIQQGERGLGRLAEYTTRAIEDTLANYIINAGGWNSVGSLNLMSSPLSSSLSLSNHTSSSSSEQNPFFMRQSSAKDDTDCDDIPAASEDMVGGECDDGVLLGESESKQSNIDKPEVESERGTDQPDNEIFDQVVSDEMLDQAVCEETIDHAVSDETLDEALNDEEQCRVNQYLGYVHAGINMMALSAGLALSLIKNQ